MWTNPKNDGRSRTTWLMRCSLQKNDGRSTLTTLTCRSSIWPTYNWCVAVAGQALLRLSAPAPIAWDRSYSISLAAARDNNFIRGYGVPDPMDMIIGMKFYLRIVFIYNPRFDGYGHGYCLLLAGNLWISEIKAILFYKWTNDIFGGWRGRNDSI
jgi:hypothetical protein